MQKVYFSKLCIYIYLCHIAKPKTAFICYSNIFFRIDNCKTPVIRAKQVTISGFFLVPRENGLTSTEDFEIGIRCEMTTGTDLL